MAKNDNQNARTSLEEFNDSLSSIEQKVEENKKYVYWTGGAVLAIVVLALIYIYGFRNPGIKNAKEDISLALKDYEKVAGEYSNSASNRANLNAAILLYQKGKYQEAADYLNDFSAKGNLVGPASQSLLGDCYVNLKKYDDAVKAFDKAISLSKDNVDYTPLFMMKKATVLRAQKKYADEAAVYQTIKDKFPAFQNDFRVNIDKYLERALAQSGK